MSVRRLPTKSARWEVILELGADPETGKRRQKRVNRDPETGLPIPTKKRALEIERAELVRRHRPGRVDPATTTVGAFLADWLDETRDSRAEGTHYHWESLVRVRLVPHIGAVLMADLTERHVAALYRALAPRYTRQSMQTTQAVLGAAMKAAVRWRVIDHNPAQGVPIPKASSRHGSGWPGPPPKSAPC